MRDQQAQIPIRDAATPVDSLYDVLVESGCLVVEGLASAQAIAALKEELASHLDRASPGEDDPDAFYPGLTRRVTGLMHRSPTARTFMMHPLVAQLTDRHLLTNCKKWQLNVSAALSIGPGARDQILHREEDLFPYWTPPPDPI